jgi:hypothetical protein
VVEDTLCIGPFGLAIALEFHRFCSKPESSKIPAHVFLHVRFPSTRGT